MKVIKGLFLIFSLFIINVSHSQNINKNTLLAAIGQVATWNNINYILFTASSKTSILKEQSYLIEKNTGRVRFEGKTNNNKSIVLLFNYKSQDLKKGFINGEISENRTNVHFPEVLKEFYEHTNLLFLPMFIISSQKNNLSISAEKIINTEKIFELNFNNIFNLNKSALNGSIFISKKGEIKEYNLDSDSFIVSETKNIGEGILLPTRFINKSNPSLNVKFNTVAAFTDVEDDKFLNL